MCWLPAASRLTCGNNKEACNCHWGTMFVRVVQWVQWAWTEVIPFWKNSSIHPHVLPPPHPHLSRSASSLIRRCSRGKGRSTSNAERRQERAWLPCGQLSSLPPYCSFDKIDRFLLNNASHLVPLFWGITCLFAVLKEEVLLTLMRVDSPLRTYTTVLSVWIMDGDYKGIV